jgi:hypothetical protein
MPGLGHKGNSILGSALDFTIYTGMSGGLPRRLPSYQSR